MNFYFHSSFINTIQLDSNIWEKKKSWNNLKQKAQETKPNYAATRETGKMIQDGN